MNDRLLKLPIHLGTGQKPCNPGFALRKTWVTGFLSCTKPIHTFFVGLCLAGISACSQPGVETSGENASVEASRPTPSDLLAQSAETEGEEAIAQAPTDQACELVESGFGPAGAIDVGAETVVSGLEVPWGIAFLPDGDMLVTERPGRLRLVQNGQLQPETIASPPISRGGEGGLLGIAVHPNFASNRQFYLYYTTDKNGATVNRVERWQLAADKRSASVDRTIVDDIPNAQFHNGGRIRFGPDGMLYIGTGDARNPDSSQDINSLAGKILRVTPDGQVPPDNPFPNNPVYIYGVRNTQGFDWVNNTTLLVTDHGPSGELGRRGHDELNVATVGSNLGWPTIYGCQEQANLVTPALVWQQALPPGGTTIYTGNTIPEWQGDLLISTLGSEHLQHVDFDPENPGQIQRHDVHLRGEFGRLREAVMGPDGALYLTTSNCDGRGNCPADGDKILRVTP